MKIKLERNQARNSLGVRKAGLPPLFECKKKLIRSGGKPAFLTPRFLTRSVTTKSWALLDRTSKSAPVEVRTRRNNVI